MNKSRSIITVFLPIAVLTLLLAPWVGTSGVDFSVLTRPGADDLDAVIFWQIRVPRVLLAMLYSVFQGSH